MRQIRRAGKRVTNSGEPCILPRMMGEAENTDCCLVIELDKQDLAKDVAAEANIMIEFGTPFWSADGGTSVMTGFRRWSASTSKRWKQGSALDKPSAFAAGRTAKILRANRETQWSAPAR